VLLACRLAGLSALEAHYAIGNGHAQLRDLRDPRQELFRHHSAAGRDRGWARVMALAQSATSMRPTADNGQPLERRARRRPRGA
jgi:hypothetical protein